MLKAATFATRVGAARFAPVWTMVTHYLNKTSQLVPKKRCSAFAQYHITESAV
jgi:hypothetical protein